MPLFVNYDRDGTITSAVEIDAVPEGVETAVLPLSDEHDVVEIELDDETRELDTGELVRRYRIDPDTRQLVKKKKKK